MLTNPVYAGAYAFGRRGVRTTIENGRKKVKRNPQRDWKAWEVLLHDRHEGYISWDDFVRNQRIIADNVSGKSFLSRGAIRRGEALLPGLLRCGRCGRRLYVQYTGRGGDTQKYVCRGEFNKAAVAICLGFGGMRLYRRVAQEVLERLQPLGVEAALNAMKAQGAEQSENYANSKDPSNRHSTKQTEPIVNTTLWIPTIATSRASLNAVGTSASTPCVQSNEKSKV
ncbi:MULTISPECIES: recombinase family protein [Brucella]|uniref:Recombinase zinc beta ribbon domain protein n=1 Tax=Brucella lupini TaxID=255457 RepID=A0A256GFZ8_9HYPH|nr:recombinase family protein [Brucella lupini]OYR26077.1 recombinase zinc beta ribbon domain protein [Brucella lupini]